MQVILASILTLCMASASWFPERELAPGCTYTLPCVLVDVILVQFVGRDRSFQITTAPVVECGAQKMTVPPDCPPGVYVLSAEVIACEAHCAGWDLRPITITVEER